MSDKQPDIAHIEDSNYGSIAEAIRALEVGQSFDFPISRRSSIGSQITRASKETKRVFASRKIDDATIRVWRAK